MPQLSSWERVGSGFDFPEGPVWDGKGSLYVANCYGGWIARIAEGRVDTFALLPPPGRPNGLAMGPGRRLYACDFGRRLLLAIRSSGEMAVLSAGPHEAPLNRPNDLAVDSSGRVYVTDPKTYGVEAVDGRIICVDVARDTSWVAASGLAFPNGIAFSPLDGKLYVSESARQRVVRFAVAGDGTLSDREVFAELPGGDPDGLAFDVQGNLYVAHFGGGAVIVISPRGRLSARVATPGRKPSNLAFGGEGMRYLFLTETETNGVYRCAVSVPGAQLPWVEQERDGEQVGK
ncbi:MAG: SMP-30/gluconolactonase/LRE family protein [Calditrichaeota bacterium]|nr:SMP-30/gluconolactonase/LRE family protein [Calditrichota bacterium]